MSGLASQTTARQGNILGILGVGSGILASLAAVGFPPEVLMQFAAVAGIGGGIGTIIGRRITATELPPMVAALHSVVGLAAVLTSIGSVLADPSHISTLHLVTAYLGVLIGAFSYTFKPRLRPDFAPTHIRTFRRSYLYWFHRRFPEISWKNVF